MTVFGQTLGTLALGFVNSAMATPHLTDSMDLIPAFEETQYTYCLPSPCSAASQERLDQYSVMDNAMVQDKESSPYVIGLTDTKPFNTAPELWIKLCRNKWIQSGKFNPAKHSIFGHTMNNPEESKAWQIDALGYSSYHPSNIEKKEAESLHTKVTISEKISTKAFAILGGAFCICFGGAITWLFMGNLFGGHPEQWDDDY